MKKFKKFFAVLLTLAMVLGMSMTTFAATEYKIKVNDENKGGATYSYVRIIEPDSTKATGWKFTNDATSEFKAAILARGEGLTDEAYDQEVIKTMTASNFQESVLRNALDKITVSGTPFTGTETTVPSAGLYKVIATSTDYSYSPMAAYVAFSGEGATATVTAKRQENKVTKTSQEKDANGNYIDTDKVVYVGEKVQYTITTTVPYLKGTNRKYEIKDEISGASYVTGTDGKVILNVKVGDQPVTPKNITMDGKDKFVVDLSNLVEDESYANKAITITYEAIVTGTKVRNSARPYYNDESGKDEPTPVELFVGSAVITKYDEDGVTVLAGAKFKILDTTTGKYAVLGDNNTVIDWNDVGTETTASNDEGKVTVNGLSKDGTFQFVETTAPDGYSLANNEDITWTDVTSSTEGNVTTYTQNGTASMTDTKLSSLPETGGIGTTIFTIGGCAIMIIAAGLFFASRRRSAK